MNGGDKIKKVFFLILLVLIFIPKEVYASEYTVTNKSAIRYEINNFKRSGNYVIINGWAILSSKQNFRNSSTHEYSLELREGSTSKQLIYTSSPKNVNKTNLFKMGGVYRWCSNSQINASTYYCNYKYEYVGFEFKIPLSDLKENDQYSLYLRVYGKLAKVKYKIPIYAPAVDNNFEYNGINYHLKSDVSNLFVKVTGNPVYVKQGPSIYSSRTYGWKWCSTGGRLLYWYYTHTYRNLMDTSQTSPGNISSETWFKLSYSQTGICQYGRARAVHGYSYSGWIPSVYTDFIGTPAKIITKATTHTNIDGVKAYTSKVGENGKVVITSTNSKYQTNTIKLYHGNTLVYNKKHSYSGKKDIVINYKTYSNSDIRVEIIEPNNYKNTLYGRIYVSNNAKYEIDSNSISFLNPNRPIMTYSSSSGAITNYYERIKITPYNPNQTVISGRSIKKDLKLDYYSDTSSITLNNNITATGYFETKDRSLNINENNNYYPLLMNNLNYTIGSVNFSLPEVKVGYTSGNIFYSSTSEITINGGRNWYIDFGQALGNYESKAILKNVGVNNLEITITDNYKVIDYLVGNNGVYNFKRIPTEENIRYDNFFYLNGGD